MKKVNWKPLEKYKLSKNCFWTEREEVMDDDVIAGLEEKFTLPNKNAVKPIVGKPPITLRVLEPNQAQNLLILLRGNFKNVPFDQIKKYILECDTAALSVQFNEGLFRCLPNHHQMKELQQTKKEQIQLSDVEDFVASLLDIERLSNRLKCINFKICYDDMVLNLVPDMRVGAAACEEMIACEKFKKVLKIILSIGNYMNVGKMADYKRSVGFELDILPKLNTIKTIDNKSTLLDYIVQIIRTKSPELWDFGDELAQVKEAARLQTANMEGIIENVLESSEFLKNEVENQSMHRLCDDKFVEVMSPFSLECCKRANELTTLMTQMKQSYLKVGEIFGFDVKTYPMETCFSDIKNFENSVMETYVKNGIPKSVDCNHHENVEPYVLPSDIKPCELKKLFGAKVELLMLTEEGLSQLIIELNTLN